MEDKGENSQKCKDDVLDFVYIQKKVEKNKRETATSTCAFPEELFNNLRLCIVAVVFGHHGTELAKLSEEAVFVLGVTELGGQRAALAGFGRGRGRPRAAARTASLCCCKESEGEQCRDHDLLITMKGPEWILKNVSLCT